MKARREYLSIVTSILEKIVKFTNKKKTTTCHVEIDFGIKEAGDDPQHEEAAAAPELELIQEPGYETRQLRERGGISTCLL